MTVMVRNLQTKEEINESTIRLLEKVVEQTLKVENIPQHAEVSLCLTDNEYIKQLNLKYRGINSPTDVLSFPMYDTFSREDLLKEEELLLGDIVISVEKARSQSKDFAHSFEREIGYLTVHGMLHLLGYDHDCEESKKNMRAKEEYIMEKLRLFR